MKIKLFALFAVLTSGVVACTPLVNWAQSVSVASTQSPTNLVSLFLVKKDNLRNEFRGEVYPLALLINGRYVDVSQDLTLQVRNDFAVDRLVELNEDRSMLRAIQNFTVLNDSTRLGQFTVDKLSVGQFTCSSLLIGQGQFTGDRSLPELYRTLPDDRASGFSGSVGEQQFDESWKWAIATSQYKPLSAPNLPAVAPDQFKQDLLTIGEPLIQQEKATLQAGEEFATEPTVVESVAVYDLDRDGQPEVLGRLRKGIDPATASASPAARTVTVYANVWLGYKSNQPALIADEVTLYRYPVTRSPSDVIGIVDLNNDGTEEVIVRNNGYESTGFSIYELKGTQLEEVFSGAQYGC
ncbi:hypothetical protein IFO70_09725 [Phormidium tenue FACHB-886]|nr:hypothetical protein [Phormidium tenue FACHB-886]